MGDVATGRKVKRPISIFGAYQKRALGRKPPTFFSNTLIIKEAFSNALWDACIRRNKHGHAASQLMHVEANADADEMQVLVHDSWCVMFTT